MSEETTMTPSTPQVTFQFRRRPVSAPPAAAAGSDQSPVRAAFADYLTLGKSCQAAINAVKAGAFGPYSGAGSCTFDCDTQTQHWKWEYDFRGWAYDRLLPAVGRIDALSGFDDAFQPSRQWLAALSDRDGKIDANYNYILQIFKAIESSGGRVSPTQAESLRALMGAMSAIVSESNSAVGAAIGRLAGFLARQEQLRGSLGSARTLLKTDIDQNINDALHRALASAKCGSTGIIQQFNNLKTDVDRAFLALHAPFDDADTKQIAATQGGSRVTGALVNVQSHHQSTAQALVKAQAQQAGSGEQFIEISVAVRLWKSLIAFARTQLET